MLRFVQRWKLAAWQGLVKPVVLCLSIAIKKFEGQLLSKNKGLFVVHKKVGTFIFDKDKKIELL